MERDPQKPTVDYPRRRLISTAVLFAWAALWIAYSRFEPSVALGLVILVVYVAAFGASIWSSPQLSKQPHRRIMQVIGVVGFALIVAILFGPLV